ncbi:MAG: hypothetical protein IPN17_21830 [Deltaproteobacteria bacterium]|nr:hypothetical protein [Deltaproteobacteria bacterium]
MPLLLAFFESAVAAPLASDDLRRFGEAIAWVAHHHPELRDEVLARVDACLARGEAGQHSTRYDLELTRERGLGAPARATRLVLVRRSR